VLFNNIKSFATEDFEILWRFVNLPTVNENYQGEYLNYMTNDENVMIALEKFTSFGFLDRNRITYISGPQKGMILARPSSYA